MFDEELTQLEKTHLTRRLRPIESHTETTLTLEGKTVINMASNNYLGLATHPALKEAAIRATERFGVGAGASRLISGTLPPHMELEHALAQFKGTPASLCFGSGYLANLALLTALGKPGGMVIADRLAHASLIDGCRLCGADFRLFAHNDLERLQRLLERHSTTRQTVIVTEGVFSMDGDMAPLPQLLDLAQEYQSQLIVDDAHGTGIFGQNGQGSLEFFNLQQRLPYHMGTFGKALGTGGAYIAGPSSFIDYLISTARTFLYTTAPPPATCAATLAALHIIQSEPERRARLWANREYLYSALSQLGFTMTNTVSPIIPILIGDTEQTLMFAQLALKGNVFAPAIRPPTVPKGSSRIRLTVTSEHSQHQLDHVLQTFDQIGQQLGIL